mgnify:CR=1 FL=1
MSHVSDCVAAAAAAVALWDLGVARSRLRAGWPARRVLTSLMGLSRQRPRRHAVRREGPNA